MIEQKKIENKKVVAVSTKNYGIAIENGDIKGTWYNFDQRNSLIGIEDMQLRLSNINKGDMITLIMSPTTPKAFVDFSITEKTTSTYQPYVNNQDNQQKGLPLKQMIELSHKQGIVEIEFLYPKIDYEKKIAHIVAKIIMKNGTEIRTFMGSACKSINEMGTERQKKYWLETIESQALARALRWAVIVPEEKTEKQEDKQSVFTITEDELEND